MDTVVLHWDGRTGGGGVVGGEGHETLFAGPEPCESYETQRGRGGGREDHREEKRRS